MAEAGVASRLKQHVPWWAKIVMDAPKYALSVFRRHFDRVEFGRKNGGFTALELGPGDSVASAIIAQTFGAGACYLVDSGEFATGETEIYRQVICFMKEIGLDCEDIPTNATLTSVLEQFGGIYLTNGLESLRSIPDESIDFIWSQAVLEHIRLKDFDDTLGQMRRVLRLDGVCSHRVDFRDHLSGSLNNLRFSESVWEADWMATSGFYTNRIQFREMNRRFERAKFEIRVIHTDRWSSLPISRQKLDQKFASLDDDDLLVKGCDVVLKPMTE